MNYDGDLEAEADIVKIALCGKYQEEYSTLETACRRAGLYPAEAEAIRLWRQHGTGKPTNEIDRLFYYFQYEEPQRYSKAVYFYNNKR